MSGSCSTRVCWRRLPSIRTVGEALGGLYDGASHVKLVQPKNKPFKLRRRDPDHKKLIKSDLVYLEESPDYCERNDEYVLNNAIKFLSKIINNLFFCVCIN